MGAHGSQGEEKKKEKNICDLDLDRDGVYEDGTLTQIFKPLPAARECSGL